jgi:hypothetical protein
MPALGSSGILSWPLPAAVALTAIDTATTATIEKVGFIRCSPVETAMDLTCELP